MKQEISYSAECKDISGIFHHQLRISSLENAITADNQSDGNI
jgi:hypothetical protein